MHETPFVPLFRQLLNRMLYPNTVQLIKEFRIRNDYVTIVCNCIDLEGVIIIDKLFNSIFISCAILCDVNVSSRKISPWICGVRIGHIIAV